MRHLACLGWTVTGLTRNADTATGVRQVRMGSYEDVSDLRRAFEGQDAVIHLAGLAHARLAAQAFDVNVRAAEAVARAAVEARVRRIVFVSSIGVNGSSTREGPFSEVSPPAPAEPYARSKLGAEDVMLRIRAATSTQLVIVRPPLVHGPHAPGNFGSLWRAVARGVPLPLGRVHNRRSLVGVDNLADMLALCTEHPAAPGELFLVSDDEDVSTAELIRRIADAQGRRPRIMDVPIPLVRAAAALVGRGPVIDRLGWSLQVDSSKVRTVLGWRPRFTLDEGLTRAARIEAGAAA